MPKAKATAKKGSKKTWKKKGTRAKKSTFKESYSTVSKVPTALFSAQKIAYLTYFDAYQIVTTAGAAGTWLFNINSLFDPDSTHTGHQPMYFDQIKLLYSKYKVISAKIKIQANTSGATPGCLQTCTYTASPPTSLGEATEFARKMPRLIILYQHIVENDYLDIAQILGIDSKAYYANPEYDTDVGSNPGRLAYYQITVNKVNSTEGDCTIDVQTFITFKCLFSQIVDPGQS